MTKAKLFITGGSQAVRLPAEFRFEGDEVDIRRDATTGAANEPKHIEIFPAGSHDNLFEHGASEKTRAFVAAQGG